MSTDDSEICRCGCHEGKLIHFTACCDLCPFCNQRIKRRFEDHKRECLRTAPEFNFIIPSETKIPDFNPETERLMVVGEYGHTRLMVFPKDRSKYTDEMKSYEKMAKWTWRLCDE